MIVPAMTVDILKHVTSTQEDKLSSLKYVVTGSAPTPPDLAKNFLKAVPHLQNFYIRYGSTETGGCMTMPFPTDNPEDGVASVGFPLDLTEVKVCHPKTGSVVPIGCEGELWVRGHHVMPGYFKSAEKTAEAIENGWFKTGDMGVMDDKGSLSLKGRTKEMIIRGGENIYPKELENLLHTHPEIAEAYVCPVPDDRMGQEICAWVSLKDKSKEMTEEDIKSFCQERISYFKVPKYILFVDDFPRTPKGSPQKFLMSEKSCEILGIPKE
jgi:fatty-acyl-CoA synthase